MDEPQAREFLDTLRRELNETRSLIVAARQREAAITKAIEGMEELFPDVAATTRQQVATVHRPDRPKTHAPGAMATDHSPPKGQEAVVRIMESPQWRGRYWTVAQMTEEMERMSWLPDSENPSSAIRQALIRAAASHPQVHKGTGTHGRTVYFFQHPDMDPPRFHDQSDRELSPALGYSLSLGHTHAPHDRAGD